MADFDVESNVVRENIAGASESRRFDAESVGDLVDGVVEFELTDTVIDFALKRIWKVVFLGGSFFGWVG